MDTSNGLHDGSLNNCGQRYFQCKPQHGVFVRGQNLRKYIGNCLMESKDLMICLNRLHNSERRTHSLSSSIDISTKHTSRLISSDYDTTSRYLIRFLNEHDRLSRNFIDIKMSQKYT